MRKIELNVDVTGLSEDKVSKVIQFVNSLDQVEETPIPPVEKEPEEEPIIIPEVPIEDPVEPPVVVVPPVYNPPYKRPVVINSENPIFRRHIYIDPKYEAGGDDGSKERPYKNIHVFRNGIPSNTAFHFKTDTVHEKIGQEFGGYNSVYQGMKYLNNLFTYYGKGKRPIIEGLYVMGGSDSLTVDGLKIHGESHGKSGQDALIYLHNTKYYPTSSPYLSPNNIVFANCIIEGKRNTNNYCNPHPLPYFGFKGHTDDLIIYNSEFKNIWTDAIDAAGGKRHSFIRNYIHDINHQDFRADVEGWPNPNTKDPWGKLPDTRGGSGDGFQAISATDGHYFAGNIVDRSNSKWKFCWITNAGWDSNNRNLILEYNTFISPKAGAGGASIYWNTPKESIFRKNLIDGTNKGRSKGVNCFTAGYGIDRTLLHLNQPSPYGVLDNHFILHGEDKYATMYPETDAVLDSSNKIFKNYNEYLAYLENNSYIGSDIDTDNFLSEEV